MRKLESRSNGHHVQSRSSAPPTAQLQSAKKKPVVSGRIWMIVGITIGLTLSMVQHSYVSEIMTSLASNNGVDEFSSFNPASPRQASVGGTNTPPMNNGEPENEPSKQSLYKVILQALFPTSFHRPPSRILQDAELAAAVDDDDNIGSEEQRNTIPIMSASQAAIPITDDDKGPSLFTAQNTMPLAHRAYPPDKDILKDTDDSFPLEQILTIDVAETLDPNRLVFYDEASLERDRRWYQEGRSLIQPTIKYLLKLANASLFVGPWSVTDKPEDSVAPSGDPHDYFHPAPYFWPPTNADGTINPKGRYVWVDGKRVPGTVLYGEFSERFDRTRLAAMTYNTTVLSLTYYMTKNVMYAHKAADNIRVWFLAEETKMTPHLTFAQIRRNHKYKTGAKSGVIEMKDVYFFLDAVRILERDGFLFDDEQEQLRAWFQEYLTWLKESRQGRLERQTLNNHGLYYDVQIVSVAAYVNDTDTMSFYLNWNLDRLDAQINDEGAMIHELARPTCEHYQMFTLQGWSTMARVALSVGRISLWDSYLKDGRSAMCRAAKYSVPYFRPRPPCNNTQKENYRRWWPLLHEARHYCRDLGEESMVFNTWMNSKNNVPTTCYKMPSMYNPHDGIPPFWNLGSPQGAKIYSIHRPNEQMVVNTGTDPTPSKKST